MATNSSRGNPIAARDGPPVETTSAPPRLPQSVKAEILHRHQQQPQHGSSNAGAGPSAGLHDAGEDAGAVAPGAHVETAEEAVAGGAAAAAEDTVGKTETETETRGGVGGIS